MSEHRSDRAAAQANHDRATQVATDVIRVIVGSLRDWAHSDLRVPRPVRRELEAMLREFEDRACQARNKHEHTDNDGPNEKRSGGAARHQSPLATNENFKDDTFEPDDTVEEVVSDAARPSLF